MLRSPLKARRTIGIAIVAFVVVVTFAIAWKTDAQAAPESLQGLLSRAFDLERTKDFAGAEAIYRQALVVSPGDPDLLKRLGQVCQDQGKHEESIRIFQEILMRA